MTGRRVGERQLRRLLWALSALPLGDPTAIAVLQDVEVIERDLGTLPPSCTHLLMLVKTSNPPSGRKIVDELSIPSPWLERFTEASVGSTRVKAGPYFDDLEKFVGEWEKEMTFLMMHRSR